MCLGCFRHGGRFPRYLHLVLGYYDCKLKLAAWHQAELEKLDPLFKLQQDGLRLVVAREKALAEGIGPLDPRYPVIYDFDKIAHELRGMKEAMLAAEKGIFLKK